MRYKLYDRFNDKTLYSKDFNDLPAFFAEVMRLILGGNSVTISRLDD